MYKSFSCRQKGVGRGTNSPPTASIKHNTLECLHVYSVLIRSSCTHRQVALSVRLLPLVYTRGKQRRQLIVKSLTVCRRASLSGSSYTWPGPRVIRRREARRGEARQVQRKKLQQQDTVEVEFRPPPPPYIDLDNGRLNDETKSITNASRRPETKHQTNTSKEGAKAEVQDHGHQVRPIL